MKADEVGAQSDSSQRHYPVPQRNNKPISNFVLRAYLRALLPYIFSLPCATFVTHTNVDVSSRLKEKNGIVL